YRHLECSHCNGMACLPAPEFRIPAWIGQFCQPNSNSVSRTFAGVWVDRWNRHRVLVVTQILSMVQSFGLAVLALTHVITVRDVILLNLFQGVVNAFDMPARQAFVIEMVEHTEDLGNAIALNSSLVNAARLIGPSVAG